MDAGVITGAVGIAISVLTVIYGAINHKRLRSTCCNKELVMSVDVEATTPPLKIKTEHKVECDSSQK